jgi:hypothetical protein
MISHIVALIVSMKWFFRRPKFSIQVDKHLMMYCLTFYVRLGYSYYRYRKYFKNSLKNNMFELKTCEFNEKTQSSLGLEDDADFCVIC